MWRGLGLHYGHHITTANYVQATVSAELDLIKGLGFPRLKIAMSVYTDSASISTLQSVATLALSKGFYVIFGVSTPGTVTSTIWSAFKTYVTGTLATWMQTNGISEFCLGNEIEGKVDGTTLLASTVRSDIRSMASTIKTGGYTGFIDYSTTVGQIASWQSDATLGGLDYIGFNSYDVFSNFIQRAQTIKNTWGNNAIISEFGCMTNGYSDYNNEYQWYIDLQKRINVLRNYNLKYGYIFCWRDGSYGMPQDTYALKLSTGNERVALKAALDQTLLAKQKVHVNAVPYYSSPHINSSYIVISPRSTMNFTATGQYSFMGWTKITPSTQGPCTLLHKAAEGTSGFQIYVDDGYNLRYLYFQERKSYTSVRTSIPIPRSNNWMHVVLLYDGIGQTITFYINGSQYVPGTAADFTKIVSDTTSSLMLGKDYGPETIVGKMSNWGKWDRLLTEAEIQQHYQSLALPVTPSAYWPLDDGTGATVRDTSGNGNTGTFAGAQFPTWSSDSPYA